jgi:hypothetical protein
MRVPSDCPLIMRSFWYCCSSVSCVYTYMSCDNALYRPTRPQMDDRVIWVTFLAGKIVLSLILTV